ncbi:histidine kinase [Streptomyces sp. NBC_01280]|uniref:sensor histidine kinase n=1 Tax=unclassified Streptomyces TaxID=2593676 RepID=UPI002E338B95|nr:histidine kinase [Streptomyces sp. NBC_01280]WSE12526.1 histidine kinase [Streptomyces sp. NBC_01397]
MPRTAWQDATPSSLRRTDAAVAAAAALAGFGNSWVKPSNGLLTGAPTVTVAVLSGAVGLLLWWRRERTVVIGWLVVLCHLLLFTPTALAVALYTVGSTYPNRWRLLAWFAGLGCLSDAGALWLGGAWDFRGAAYSLALVVGPLVVGYAVALRRDLATAAQAELATREREHVLLVEQARVNERSRIARDMHDVVAHRVGHIVLLAAALRVGAGSVDRKVAEDAEQIRHEGRRALEELRAILGVLTPDGAGRPAPRAPHVDAGDLDDLVHSARRAGLHADLSIEGEPGSLPTLVQQAVYRTLQESLTNAAKYAPGAEVGIELRCGPDTVDLTVVNGPASGPPADELPSGGNGLLGLNERASLLGGELAAGPEGGGFRVELHVPLTPPDTL